MAQDILDLVIGSAEGSFLQVTVFVGAVLIIFGYINYKKQGGLIESIERGKKWQPIVGAFIGLTPGCGGAIFIMPLYLKGSVSFGTVVATLIATAGDSAFVMISAMPLHYLLVSLLSFITAIASGYVVDYLKVGQRTKATADTKPQEAVEDHLREADHRIQNQAIEARSSGESDRYVHIGHEEGDEIDRILHHKLKGHQDPDSFGHRITHNGYWIYWVSITIGLVLGTLLLFQVDVNAFLFPNFGLIVGVGGTLLSVVLIIMGKKFLGDDTHEESELKLMSMKETFIHNAQETAFVGTWVFAAYLIYELIIYAVGGGDYAHGEELAQDLMTSAGLAAVIVGALVGLIPGCGPQIIFVALFIKGWLPFAALLSNAISQDGDALFPLLAMDKKSAFKASVVTTIPALIVGVLFYYFEINFFAELLKP